MGRSPTRRRRKVLQAPSFEEDEELELGVTQENDTNEEEQENEFQEPEAGSSNAHAEDDEDPQRDDQEVDISDPVIAGLRASMDNLIQLVKDIMPTCYTDDKKAEVENRLKTCMLKLVRSELNYIEGVKIVVDTAASIGDVDEEADDTAILAHCDLLESSCVGQIDAHRNSLRDSALKKYGEFVRLMKEFEDLANPNYQPRRTHSGGSTQEPGSMEDDDEVADLDDDDDSEMIPIRDPITKLLLTDPVRNKYCNHIYGYASILQMIKTNKTRCPTVGCSNKRPISHRHIVQDAELTAKVQMKVKQYQQAKDASLSDNDFEEI